MVIAARTGQGKTLCFGIPMLELLIRRLTKAGHENDEFDCIKEYPGLGIRDVYHNKVLGVSAAPDIPPAIFKCDLNTVDDIELSQRVSIKGPAEMVRADGGFI